ncbi:MAG: phosphatidylinositol 4-kinase [Defluviitaleaceae bacterium]|nr:phosphatidylinositol 4-kinase [Defluviitaleaceae bacterium]
MTAGHRAYCNLSIPDETLLDLSHYRKSLNRGAGASRPKRVYTSPRGEVYFKFDLTNNEICAELFAYALAIQLDIPVAETKLARSDMLMGVASYDVGVYTEPQDKVSYSVKDFISLNGFVQMCLFDYLIMNEDRHAGNWGITDGCVASLFDHNYAFGGDEVINDIDYFMRRVTTPFYVTDENKQRHDTLLKYFVKYHNDEVNDFIQRLSSVTQIRNPLWEEHFPQDCARLNVLLKSRIAYMTGKAGEYRARQIDDNEF